MFFLTSKEPIEKKNLQNPVLDLPSAWNQILVQELKLTPHFLSISYLFLKTALSSQSMVRLMNPRLCLLWCGGAALVLLLLLATRPKEDEMEGIGDPVKGAARALHQAAAALLPPPASPGVSPPLLQVSTLAKVTTTRSGSRHNQRGNGCYERHVAYAVYVAFRGRCSWDAVMLRVLRQGIRVQRGFSHAIALHSFLWRCCELRQAGRSASLRCVSLGSVIRDVIYEISWSLSFTFDAAPESLSSWERILVRKKAV